METIWLLGKPVKPVSMLRLVLSTLASLCSLLPRFIHSCLALFTLASLLPRFIHSCLTLASLYSLLPHSCLALFTLASLLPHFIHSCLALFTLASLYSFAPRGLKHATAATCPDHCRSWLRKENRAVITGHLPVAALQYLSARGPEKAQTGTYLPRMSKVHLV